MNLSEQGAVFTDILVLYVLKLYTPLAYQHPDKVIETT